MKVVIVKHKKGNKPYWFEVPESLAKHITSGTRVICDTVQGDRKGITVTPVMDAADDGLWRVIENSGAVFPLKKVTAVLCDIPIENVKIPEYMRRTKPHGKKIVKRFREYYYTGYFNTEIIIDNCGVLTDGYSAYLVAKKVGLNCIPVIYKTE